MSVQSDAKGFQPPCKRDENHLSPDYEIKHEEEITILESTEVVEQFLERKELLISPFEYSRDGTDPGLVLIFNQQTFEDKSYRLGSRRDVNEIITSMSRLGFNINKDHVFNDFTREKILAAVNRIVKMDLSQVNCLIVFFLTHGDSFNTLNAHDVSLKTNELWQIFAECDDLKNKPKMFIFQACKGEYYSTISDQADGKIDLVDDSTFQSDHIGPDMVVVYSTTEGNVSFRDPKTGSWFIQELCKNFSGYGRRDDVISLIIRTTKCLCLNYYHTEGGKIKKQMPIFISTLRKKFYLNRSKERNILYNFIQEQENMKNSIKELETKVVELLEEKEKRNK